ncbi:MAG: tol-pal system protein YbgF [Gammaproteobacteria bacterium]
MQRASSIAVFALLSGALAVAGPARAADDQSSSPSGDSSTLVQIVTQLDQLQADMRQLRGQLQVQEHQLQQLQSRQRELYVDLDRRLRRLEVASGQGQSGGGAAASQGASTGSSSAPPTPAGNQASGASAPQSGAGGEGAGPAGAAGGSQPSQAAVRAAYEKALNILKDGQYDQAAKSFEAFLKAHPDSQYSDNAQYWLAETYYVTRKLPKALAEFQKVLAKYPHSAKVPDAQLKIGYINYERQNWSAARQALNKVVKEAPGSTAAQLAQDRLARMKREGH